MKIRLVISVILGILVLGLGAQNNPDAKRDYIWMTSTGAIQIPGCVLSGLDFNNFPPDTFSQNYPMVLKGENSSICDTSGQLLFFTNGMYVFDRIGNQMPHGDSINFGSIYEMYAANPMSAHYHLLNSIYILPSPVNSFNYYIIHQTLETQNQKIWCTLKYSIIDMNAHNGFGDVISKNNPIILDSLCWGIRTVRHANGRDWWILSRKMYSDQYFTTLLNPEGFNTYSQLINTGHAEKAFAGISQISPDGTSYYGLYDTAIGMEKIRIMDKFDFDRSTGLLKNHINLPLTDSISLNYNNLIISPNGRFIYVNNCCQIYQFDLTSTDVAGSREIIGQWDGSYFLGNPTAFGYISLGPDGKIYIQNMSPILHVIHEPDKPGLLCNFEHSAIQLPANVIGGNFGDFPNFRLGAVVGFDELQKPKQYRISAAPNPASSMIRFEVSISNNGRPMQFDILNSVGQTIRSDYFAPYQSVVSLDVSNFTNGLYQAVLRDGNIVSGSVRFVVE